MTDRPGDTIGEGELADRLESVATGMRDYGVRSVAWNKSMELRPSDLLDAAKCLRARTASSTREGL